MNLYQTFSVETLPTKPMTSAKLDALTEKLGRMDIPKQHMAIALILYDAKEHHEYQPDGQLPPGLKRVTPSQVEIHVNELSAPLQWMLWRLTELGN